MMCPFSCSNNIPTHLQPFVGYQVGLCPAHCVCLCEPLATQISQHFPQQQASWESVAHLTGMTAYVSLSSHRLIQEPGQGHQFIAHPGTFLHHAEGISFILL